MKFDKQVYPISEVGVFLGLSSWPMQYSSERCGIADILDYLVDNNFPTDHAQFMNDYLMLKGLIDKGIMLNHFISAYQTILKNMNHDVKNIRIYLVAEEAERLIRCSMPSGE